MALRFIVLLLLSAPFLIRGAIPNGKRLEMIHLAPSANMDRSDLYYEIPTGHPSVI
jgi:hypothetical protein